MRGGLEFGDADGDVDAEGAEDGELETEGDSEGDTDVESEGDDAVDVDAPHAMRGDRKRTEMANALRDTAPS